ncbi:general substrate transporter [Xylariaceae sp. FL0804]|nr:general substrate transporter [Xylariaceae sp. FL0804]
MERLPGFNVANHLEKKQLLIAINCVAALSIFFFGYDQGTVLPRPLHSSPPSSPQTSIYTTAHAGLRQLVDMGETYLPIHTGMMGGVNNAKDYIDLMGFGYVDPATQEPVVTDSLLQGGIVSVYYLGTLIGCLLGGWIGDRIGRVRTIAFGAAWAVVGAALQCSAMNHDWMICARAVNGIGTGILNAIVPVWATETAEHTSRGQFIAIEFTLNIFGVVVAYWLEFGLSFIDGGDSAVRWRLPIAFQILPLLVLLASVWFFPESPRWLVKAGRDDEARYILRRLRGSADNRAEAEFQDIRNIVALEARESRSNSYFHMLFGIGSGELHTGRRVQLVIWLQVLQEWVGIAGVTVYAPTIFRIAGFDTVKSQWISGLNNIFYMFATLVCVFTLDRIGRRWTLWWGAAAQGVAMFLAGGLAQAGEDARAGGNVGRANAYGAAAAAFVFVFTSVFGATWLTVPWLYPAEIFPLQVRAKGNAWGVVGWSIGNGWLTLLCPVMFSKLGATTLHIFGACNILAIPVVWALYPESNQRTLEEMDLLFAAPTPWVWDAEKTFARLKAEQPELVQAAHRGEHVVDPESGIPEKAEGQGVHREESDGKVSL